MMTRIKSEQEEFWVSEFGDAYIQRNNSDTLLASNLHFFSRALRSTTKITSCLEFGANIGMNLRALSLLLPRCELSAVEINSNAVKVLKHFFPNATVFEGAIQDYPSSYSTHDLVFTKGVLIHLDPHALRDAYEKMYIASRRHILIAEYYSPKPTAITYRGYENKLFKRDFAGEMLEQFPDLRLLDYGFSYWRDAVSPQDDITWFLLQKTSSSSHSE